ncbi:MAG: HU family DNA-binding protein, partial [Thermoplasmata archaeon]
MVRITDIRKNIASRTNLKKKDVKKILDTFFGEVLASVNKGKKVSIKGFGTFTRRVQKAKKVKDPKTKAVINVPEKNKFVFKPSSKIKYKEEESIYDIGPLAYGRIPP